MSEFFSEQKEQSEVKSLIVSEYFDVWANVMNSKARSQTLAYIDLFSGPGRYKDGSKSTPIKVLETIISKPDLCKKMATIFNDANPEAVGNLQEEIQKLEGIKNLQHKPFISNSQVGDELVELFGKTHLVPTLAFVDPFGYKGMSSKLIGALIKDWGSDCIFFFNYNRINMGITNQIVVKHMNSIFGKERAEKLRDRVAHMTPDERELTILEDLSKSLTNNGSNYVLPFRFVRANGKRTSHYLILVTKHVLGYTLMKKIMYKHSSEHDDGVASFSYVPVINKQLEILYGYSRPLDELGEKLNEEFLGRTLTVKEIHDLHQVGTPYVMENYKEALRRLESEDRVTANPSADQRPKRKGIVTLAEKTEITFP